MHLRLALAAALILAPSAALADQTGQYWGMSVDNAKLDAPDNGREGYATNLGLHAGYHFGDFVAAEVQVGGSPAGGIGDPYYAAGFGRFNLPFEKVNVYLLAGAAAVSFDGGGPDGRDTETDLAGGIGVELYGTEHTGVRFEYTNLADGTYQKLGLGFVHYFDWPAFR
jgi:hypothetical protein